MKATIFTILCLAFAFFFLYPVGSVLWTGLWAPAAVSWGELRAETLFTYGQALLSALAAGLVGLVGAILWSENRFPGRELLWRLSLVPFSLPPILAILGFLGFWGRRGAVNQFFEILGWPSFAQPYGWNGIIALHAFFNFPLYLRLVGSNLANLDRSTEMAALSLGASRLRCFLTITLPKLRSSIRSAFFLSFLFSAASFLVVLMVGGGPRFTSLEVAIFQAIKVDYDLGVAARIALIQFTVAVGIYAACLRSPASTAAPAFRGTPLYRFRTRLAGRLAGGSYLAVLLGLVGGPLLCLLFRGWNAPTLSLAEFARAAAASLLFAVTSASASVALATGFAYGERHGVGWRRALPALLAGFPLSVSSLFLTLGLLLAYRDGLSSEASKIVAVVLVQALLALPLVYRPVRDGYFRISENLYRSARALGASGREIFFRIELPLLARPMGLALALGVAFSLGEIGAWLVLMPGGSAAFGEPLTLLIYRLMNQYRFGDAFWAARILVLITALLSVVAARWEE